MAAVAFALAAPAAAQDDDAEEPRTAEQFIETARERYAVREAEPQIEPCPEATSEEIVVCRQYRELEEGMRVDSPTERALKAGERPPDRIPDAPYVLGLPVCGVEVSCHRVGRAPPPIYIIDLDSIPEGLTPEDAALVVRAEELPQDNASRGAASPAAAP